MKDRVRILMACDKCNKINFLILQSNVGNSEYTWQKNGEIKTKMGYSCLFEGLTNLSGCNIKLCIECGSIQGLNLKTLKKEVIEAFSEDPDTDSE